MVIGVFQNPRDAEDAILRLQEVGYDPKSISVIMQNRDKAYEFAEATGSQVTEGAVAGATTGATIGALAGLLVGIGAIAIPGIGALLIGGPLAAALGLTGAAATTLSGAATGALAGGLVGSLVGLGVPEDDAQIYEERIREGGVLLALPATEYHSEEAIRILQDFGADQVRYVADEVSVSAHREERSDYHQPYAFQYGDMIENESFHDAQKRGWFGESKRHSRAAKKGHRK